VKFEVNRTVRRTDGYKYGRGCIHTCSND